jgi:UDP-GlcNAc:undecaprenyl-phosphate GlcNAc-1-phosphate transferase
MSATDFSAFAIVFILAFSVTLILCPVADILGRRWKLVAKPDARRQSESDHKRSSKFGGLALYGGFTIAVIAAQVLNVPRFDPEEVIRLAGLILGGTFIFVVGILDDRYELSPTTLAAAQIIAAAIAIAFRIFIEYINNPLTGQQTDPWPFAVTILVTMFWLGLMINTVNFMDGLDGLAAGVAFIAGATLFINSGFVLRQTSVSLLPLALMGSSLAFLFFNFYPSRIIMGGGAYFLGYVLGTLSIIGGAKMATILLVMGLPLVDLVWQAANRLSQGRNPMRGDRGHIHFRLLDMGYSQRRIVLTYYAFCAFFGVLTLVVASQLFKFIAFGVMAALVALTFIWLPRSKQSDPANGVSSGHEPVNQP